jgi:hypothetical protein
MSLQLIKPASQSQKNRNVDGEIPFEPFGDRHAKRRISPKSVRRPDQKSRNMEEMLTLLKTDLSETDRDYLSELVAWLRESS